MTQPRPSPTRMILGTDDWYRWYLCRMTSVHPFQTRPITFGHFAADTDDLMMLNANNPKQVNDERCPPLNFSLGDNPLETAMGLHITPLTPLTPATPRLEQGIPTILKFNVASSSVSDDLHQKAPGNLSPSPTPWNSDPLAPGNIPRRKRSPRRAVSRPWKLVWEQHSAAVSIRAKKDDEAAAKKEPKKCAETAKAAKPTKKRKRASSVAEGGPAADEIQAYSRKEGWKGVVKSGTKNKWKAQIWHGNTAKYLGTYESRKEAAARYDMEVIRLRGPKLEDLNFPIENYPEEMKAYEEAQEKEAENLILYALNRVEEEEAAKLVEEEKEEALEEEEEEEEPAGKKTKRQRRTKKQTVEEAAAPLPPTSAPATTAAPKKIGSSNYHGVSWSKRSRKWRTQLWITGRGIKHVGFYIHETEAAAAYGKAKLDRDASGPKDEEATTCAVILVCLASGHRPTQQRKQRKQS